MTLSALFWRQGELDGVMPIVRDITRDQREVEPQLHQSEKLTALEQLAGGIAHDFDNLPQAILLAYSIVRRRGTDIRVRARTAAARPSRQRSAA